jgi:predicted O-methyltransferase YrrM
MRNPIRSRRARLTDYLNAGRFAAARHSRGNLVNASRFAITHPHGALVMARKGLARAVERERQSSRNIAASRSWIAAGAQDPATFARAIAPDLWDEATEFSEELNARAEPILERIPYKLHGGADHRFLYWLTRVTKPETVVETGVCAGWTSQTFLAAMRRNGRGELYSSDFPLFHIPHPESIIGCLVEDDLRDRWHLYVDADETNLPRIIAQVPAVDIFHYDSDKTYAGRSFGVDLVQTKLSSNGVIIMNDVRNDTWFYDRAAADEGETTIFLGRSRSARAQRHYGMIGAIRPAS